jgi:hypothetical protein
MDNIFKYATSEFSNDAFLCWLFSISKNKDPINSPIEYSVSQGYLRKFCKYDGIIIIDENGIIKQEKKIDVLIKGRYDNGEKFILTIENKTSSKQHSKQLERYRDYINEEYKNIKEFNRHFVYYKTAIQSDINEIVEAGYSIFQLFDIFDLLKSCEAEKSENYILKNYYDYIKEEVELYKNYEKLKINTWDDKAYQGFFYYLSDVLNKDKNIKKSFTGFDYHDNEEGGHWSLWFGNDKKVKNKYGEEVCFHLNLETSNKNGSKKWFCRLIIRANKRADNSKWKKSDIEQYIGSFGECKGIIHTTGENIILSKLFQVDKESNICSYNELEKNIMLGLKQFVEWQNKEGFK